MLSSISENHGIGFLSQNDLKIYSVGISTGGRAEIRMAMDHPERHIVATTIDCKGAESAKNQIKSFNLENQIEIKIEDVAEKLPYPHQTFDYIYARLILHYLPEKSLCEALNELYRVLKKDGKMFVVVRSVACPEVLDSKSHFDPNTHLTTYLSDNAWYSRFFHSEESIQHYLKLVGFSIRHIDTYQEQLCIDFERTKPSKNLDNLIEVLASK